MLAGQQLTDHKISAANQSQRSGETKSRWGVGVGRNTHRFWLTRVKVEEWPDKVVIELARVQYTQNEGRQSTLPSIGHGVGSGHIQRAKHCDITYTRNEKHWSANSAPSRSWSWLRSPTQEERMDKARRRKTCLLPSIRLNKFGYNRWSSFEDTVWMNTNWNFEPSLWPWPWTQQSIIFTWPFDDLPAN